MPLKKNSNGIGSFYGKIEVATKRKLSGGDAPESIHSVA